MSDALLLALKKLQHKRSGSSPFANHVEFLNWSDQVAALLSFDEKQRAAFKHCVTSADVSHNLGSPADATGSINRAIGILNQTVVSREMKSTHPQAVAEQPPQQQPVQPQLPSKLTFKWIYEHTPISFYGWLLGLLCAAFLAGIGFAETPLYSSLKGASSGGSLPGTAPKIEAPKK